MADKKRKGFDLAPNAALFTSLEKDGVWSAWVEDDAPSNPCGETIKVFEGGSAYQAQIKAIRWRKEHQVDQPPSAQDQAPGDRPTTPNS